MSEISLLKTVFDRHRPGTDLHALRHVLVLRSSEESAQEKSEASHARSGRAFRADRRRLRHRDRQRMECNAMNSRCPRLSTTPWFALVRFLRHAGLPPLALVRVVVFLRRLHAGHLRQGRRHCRGQRPGGGGHRHVGVALAPSAPRHHLRLGALGRHRGNRQGRADGPGGRVPRPVRRPLPAPCWAGACAGLRAHPLGQRGRAGGAHLADLAVVRRDPRHQGRELAAHRRLAFALLTLPAVQPHRCEVGRLQPAAGGAAQRA